MNKVATDSADLIEQGRYLAIAGNCAACHTSTDGQAMAGGLRFQTPFGVVYSTNITPDEQTGIGLWTVDEFTRAMREGVGRQGEHLYPVFPYTAYTKLTDHDITAIFAYLRSLPAARGRIPDNDMRFPFNYRALMGIWKALFFTPGAWEARADKSAQWNRGAYLVEGLGHCGACHTPRNVLGATQTDHAMHGGEYLDRVGDEGAYRTWSAPDLTASTRGLGLWTQADLVAYLQKGRNSFLESFGPMNEVIFNSTRHLSAADIDAMAVYLKSLPAAPVAPLPVPDARVMGRGRTVYNLHCGTCHLPTGEGDPEMAPRLLEGSLVVQAVNPASMINVILYGPESPEHESAQPWREPMQEFQYLLDDEEIAAVASFVRHSWGNAAGAVSAEEVARQR